MNNNELHFKFPVIKKSGQVLIPAREIANILRWRFSSLIVFGKVKITRPEDGQSLIFKPYSKAVNVNSAEKEWAEKPILYNGMTYLPLLEFCQAFKIVVQTKEGHYYLFDDYKKGKKEPVAERKVSLIEKMLDIDQVVLDSRAPKPDLGKKAKYAAPLATPGIKRKISSGVYTDTSAQSCWLPDLRSKLAQLHFEINGKRFAVLKIFYKSKVLYAPAAVVLNCFGFQELQGLPGEKDKAVVLVSGQQKLRLQFNSKYIEYAGSGRKLRSPVLTDAGVCYIPLLEVLKILKIGARWNNERRTVYIEPAISEVLFFIDDKRRGKCLVKSSYPILYKEPIKFKNPERLILDIPNSIVDLPEKTLDIKFKQGNDTVNKIRISQFEDNITRIVFDLAKPVKYSTSASYAKKQLVVDLGTVRPVQKASPKLLLPKAAVKAAKKNNIVIKKKTWREKSSEQVIYQAPEKKLKKLPKEVRKVSRASINVLKGKRIIIDAGHGGKDPGAVSKKNTYEKTINLQIAKALARILKAEGAVPILVRDKDVFVSMKKRAAFINAQKGDVLISIHLNSFIKRRVRGAEAYWYKNSDLKLAKEVHKAIVFRTQLPNKKVKKAQMYVLNHTQIPGVLIEPVFLSNPRDEALILNSQFRYNLALAIKDGLKKYFK